MSGSNSYTQVVSVQTDKADEAVDGLSGWGAVVGIHRLGDDDGRTGLAVRLLATPVSLGMGMVRQELEKRLRPFRGEIGGTTEWLLAAQMLERERR